MKGIEGLTLGRYELRRRAAQGGMAEVYIAYDRRVKRQVAIKVLYGRDENFIRRFEREALSVGALSHDHILPLYDFGEQRPWYYLVMPYVEGGTLREYLLKRKRLTLEETASFLDQIASALQHAHDHGVIHRDVKPSNILLRPDGYAYLVDFGLAKAMIGAETLTSEGAMVGTPEYMAPEQSNGKNDYRSDIYSLGVIAYQMLTGGVPFTAESPVAISLKHIQTLPTPPRKLNNSIPESVEAVILKALAKKPEERYQEAQELAAAYWKALQKEQSPIREYEALVTSSEESVSEVEEEPQVVEMGSSTTRILPESERALLNPPPTTVLFPLVKEEQAELTESLSERGTGSKKFLTRSFLLFLIFLLLLASILSLGLHFSWQGQQVNSDRPTPKIRTLGARQQMPDLTATAQAQLQATLAA
ncbi:MAG: protein kinase, partial [Chloroflexota bacterium]|nr:protein kinase [Chloroflexota bacterium]